MTTKKEEEEFKAALIAHYMPVYKVAREIGISHAECLKIEKLKFKIDIQKETSKCP